MWEQYRKTAIWTQAFILMVCAIMYYLGGVAFPAVLIVFVVMQIGGLLGSYWGANLKARIERKQGKSPLEK